MFILYTFTVHTWKLAKKERRKIDDKSISSEPVIMEYREGTFSMGDKIGESWLMKTNREFPRLIITHLESL